VRDKVLHTKGRRNAGRANTQKGFAIETRVLILRHAIMRLIAIRKLLLLLSTGSNGD